MAKRQPETAFSAALRWMVQNTDTGWAFGDGDFTPPIGEMIADVWGMTDSELRCHIAASRVMYPPCQSHGSLPKKGGKVSLADLEAARNSQAFARLRAQVFARGDL